MRSRDRSTHSGPIIAERDGLTVLDCSQCSYAHLFEFLPINYHSDFWQTRKAGELQHLLDQLDWWNRVYDVLLAELEGMVPQKKLLDAGCGYGYWLKRAIDRGWTGMGLEPSDEASAHASELTDNRVIATHWDGWEANGFGAVTAHWLLEHLPNPESFLDWCHDALMPFGVLMLIVPNEWTQAQEYANARAMKRNWWLDPTHYSYFSAESLERLLEASGFTVIRWMGTFPMERYVMKGLDYTEDPAVGRACHRQVEQSELASSLPELRQRYAIRGARGRDLIAFCKRAGEE